MLECVLETRRRAQELVCVEDFFAEGLVLCLEELVPLHSVLVFFEELLGPRAIQVFAKINLTMPHKHLEQIFRIQPVRLTSFSMFQVEQERCWTVGDKSVFDARDAILEWVHDVRGEVAGSRI